MKSLFFLPSILLTLIFSLSDFYLYAEEPLDLSAESQVVPSTTIALTETAAIMITFSANQKIFFSSFTLPASDDFHFLKSEMAPLEKSGQGKWMTKITISFLPLNIGELVFPSLELPYSSAGDKKELFKTPPLKLTVVSSIKEAVSPEMLKDIKPPIQIGLSSLMITLLVLAFVMALIAWIFWRHKKPAGMVPVSSVPAKPADESALEKLQLIFAQYKSSGDLKFFYSELSNILRDYLSQRYKIDALEKTTSEIFSEMRKIYVDRKICLQTKEILSICDLVKFAKFFPSEKQLEADYQRAKTFIEETKITIKTSAAPQTVGAK